MPVDSIACIDCNQSMPIDIVNDHKDNDGGGLNESTRPKNGKPNPSLLSNLPSSYPQRKTLHRMELCHTSKPL